METSTSRSDAIDDAGRRLLELMEQGHGSALSTGIRNSLFAALIRAYAADWHAGAPPFPPGKATTDEVVVTAAEMLRACDVTSFELAAMFGV